jgi:single-strand DNA-binding protein
MLRLSLIGNLGAAPEQRYTQTGAAITSFRVAVNQTRRTGEGEREQETHWFRVSAMGYLAEPAARLDKGDRVLIVGRLQLSSYQSRDGETRTGYDIWADEVVTLSGRAPVDTVSGPVEGQPASALSKSGRWAGRATQAAEIEEVEDVPPY